MLRLVKHLLRYLSFKSVSVVTSVPNFEATGTEDVSLNWSNYVLGDSNP